MTETQIENILRNPPRIASPSGLLQQLESEISLRPRSAPAASFAPFWKRWVPALSFGLLVLGCLVALGVQTSQLVQLNRENSALQRQLSAMRNAPQVADDSLADQLQGLRKDYEELQKLRLEVQQLRQQIAQLPELKSQQESLLKQLRAKTAAANADDPFAAHKAAADNANCINNLKQIGLALRMWSNDHGDAFPPNLLSAKAELNTPKVLICRADPTSASAPTTWEQFNLTMCSYEYLAPGANEGDPYVVLTRCRIHGHVGLADGSAHQAPAGGFKFVTENGLTKVQRTR